MTTNNLNVCLLPLHIKWNDVEDNILNFKDAVTGIHPKTDLLILPETFLTGFPVSLSRKEVIDQCISHQQDIIDLLKAVANKFNLAICGSMILYKDNNLTNSAFFIEPNGDMLFEPKRHLFSMAKENYIFENGSRRLQVRYRGWNIAVCVCYDLRFPVWNRNIANEYDLMVYVANWPEVRISAWDKLLPARAIENQSYVCGVDCTGTDSKGYVYNGSSHIIDFLGENIGKDFNNDLIYASLSLDRLISFRKKFPAWKDADSFNINV